MKEKEQIVILIPAYEPDYKLTQLVEGLTNLQFNNILVINDGSSAKYDAIFDQIEKNSNVKVIKHAVNQGKGRALKTGFNHILNEYKHCVGCVTVDSDGQHLPIDIESCAVALIENPNKLVLGVRNFDDKSVPLRSKFGNKMTRGILSFVGGIKVKDTQTGLRAFSNANMGKFMQTDGEKYEFEMNMLMDSKEQNIDIVQVPITTVYIDNNDSSHFNPILDSLKIYKVFFKYIISSFSSSLVDITLFTILVYFLDNIFINNYILISTVIARVISNLFNYRLNFEKVFNSEDLKKGSFTRYIILAIIQMLASAFLVSTISQSFSANEILVKIIVDVGLFFISFVIQREVVFTKEKVGL